MSAHLVIKEIEQENVKGLLPLEGSVIVLANGELLKATVKEYPLRAVVSPENCELVQKTNCIDLE